MLKFAEHTAHLVSWIPEGHQEVLYLSPNAIMKEGEAIRGGVPICWPWFGPRQGKPSHGTARISPWQRKSENKFKLFTNEATLTLLVEEDGPTLTLTLITKNTMFRTFEVTQALHTYFQVGNIHKISIHGHEENAYYDKVLNEHQQQKGTLIFNGETDRIYLTAKPSIIKDPILKREITVSKEGSGSTVIWNPGAKKSREIKDLPDDGFEQFVCVEAANTHLDPVKIKPNDEYTIKQKISINSSK
ncbi:D-hexose-6-phosphate mutarotase [Portibacter marinus]|uniref:D-hexose-6-phosphate mutarotase n=1 Tax=Portibacter marinus TaxID=2898660 RepID=UPI001F336EF8|nr:D-hexose-6-phosphate mutarotase [Portibacter marinus]